MERDGGFWMSMVKKYEKRNNEIHEKHCTLQQRLNTLKYKMSSSRQSLRDSSSSGSSCSCCVNSDSSTEGSAASVTSSPPIKCQCKPKLLENSSTCCDNKSVDSMELEYIAKLHDLIGREKQMKMQVKDMEIREKAFIDTIKKADEMYASLETKYKKRMKQEEKNDVSKYEKMTKELLEENTCLCNQLQDAKMELKHCVEKLQGPISRQMEQEKRKSVQLENELKLASKEMQDKDCCYNQDVCELQKKLGKTTENLTAINALNDTLQKEMCSLSRKYKDLQKDLINQKINEAHMLECVNEMMDKDKAADRAADRAKGLSKETQFSLADPKMTYNLHEVARKLSNTLVNVNQCSNCSTMVPQDLKDTMRGIVVIADIIAKNCKSNATVDGFDDSKPPSPPKPSNQNETPTEPNFENEEPVHDINLDEPTKLNIEKHEESGPVDNVEHLTSLLVRSCQNTKIEKRLVRERGKVCDESVGTVNNKIEDVRIIPFYEAGDVQIVTQVLTSGDLQVGVETALEICNKTSKNIHTTASFTTSGMLEIVTEGPAGIIETAMIVTPRGSVEVITTVADHSNDLEKSKILNISSELGSIKEKISAATPKDVILISDMQSIDTTVGEVSSFADTLSIPEELIQVDNSLPPAEPIYKKIKNLNNDIEIIYEQDKGEIEDFQVEIEITEPPLLKKLGQLLEAPETFQKTKLRKKVEEVMEKGQSNVANALKKANYDLAEALEKANQDVETALVSLLINESDKELIAPCSSTLFQVTVSELYSSLTTTSIITESLPAHLTFGLEQALDEIEVLSSEFRTAGGDVLYSVCDTDTDVKKLENVEINKKNQLEEKVQVGSKSHSHTMAEPAECDCGSCLCEECSERIMNARSGKKDRPKGCTCSPDCTCYPNCTCKPPLDKIDASDASNVCKDPHPPDCNCIDCLCKPCATFPADYKTRVHPPGCDCVDCLCMTSPCSDWCDTEPITVDPGKDKKIQKTEDKPKPTAIEKKSKSLEKLQHNPDCECDACKCCKCDKTKRICGACDQESHISTCTCLDCLLTCGTRANVTEKLEHLETCSCKNCDKICDNSCNVKETCRREKVSYQDNHTFDCDCSDCKLACGNECGMKMPPICKPAMIQQSENKIATVPDLKPQKTMCEPPKQTTESVPLPQDNNHGGDCDCIECKNICENLSCGRILKIKQDKKNLEEDTKIKKDLKDIESCLNRIECACAEAEATACKPSRSKTALSTFRNVVENLQEKCKEKDKVVSDMIKEMKARIDKNVFCNLLGLTSKEEDVITQSDIYCCACDEDRTKLEDVRYSPCCCGNSSTDAPNRLTQFDSEESSESVTDSCSCSCCTEFEEIDEKEAKPSIVYPSSEGAWSCSCQQNSNNFKQHSFAENKPTKCCMTESLQKNVKSASEGTCPYCYQEKSVGTDVKKTKVEQKPIKRKDTDNNCGLSLGEPQKVRICMKAETLQKEIKNALLSITEMRKIADALLIKWSKATCKGLIGYEVVIDGQIKSKIRSPDRTSTLIYSVTSKKPITVTVYPLSPQGRCLPAAKAVFDA